MLSANGRLGPIGVPVVLNGDPAKQFTRAPTPANYGYSRIVNYAGILAETTVPSQSKRGDAMVKERVHVRPPYALTRELFFDGNDHFKIGTFGGDANPAT